MTCLGRIELVSGSNRADTQVREPGFVPLHWTTLRTALVPSCPVLDHAGLPGGRKRALRVSLGWGPGVIHKGTALQCLTTSLRSPRRRQGGWMESVRLREGRARLWT